MLCLIFGIFAAIISNTTEDYHVAIVGFLAVGLVLTTSSVNNLLYTSDVARQGAAAGFIVLSIVDVRWPIRSKSRITLMSTRLYGFSISPTPLGIYGGSN